MLARLGSFLTWVGIFSLIPAGPASHLHVYQSAAENFRVSNRFVDLSHPRIVVSVTGACWALRYIQFS